MLYESTRAARAIEIRKTAAENGEKLTEEGLKNLLACDRTLQQIQKSLLRAEEKDEYAQLLLEGYRMRRDSIDAIARLAGGEIAMQRSMDIATHKVRDARAKLSEKYREE